MSPLTWSLILLVLGLLLFGLEFFLPSAGFLGILCAVCLCASVVLAFMHHWIAGVSVIISICVLLPLLFSLGVEVWPHTPIGRRILIGRVSKDDLLPESDTQDELKSLIGRIGLAKSKMLPSGIVKIDDVVYDSISDGFPIDEGDRVKVVAVRHKRIVIRPANEQSEQRTATTDADRDLLSQSIEALGIEPLDES
jgi:membrane-bound serine protease (ClpP class)